MIGARIHAAVITALALAVTGCAATPHVSPTSVATRTSAAVDRLVLLNAAAERAVAIFRPWLAPDRAARVDSIAARIDAAIATVGAARDLAAQAEAVAAAEALIAEMKWIAGA